VHARPTIAAVPFSRVNDPEKLKRLIAAVLMVSAEIELSALLRHLVEEARSLVGARYGALGVLDETRTVLEQFLTVGLSEHEEERIGDRPTGRGVLGLLITEPHPLRLSHLDHHPEHYGVPPGHPVMTTFLGVPVRVQNEVYGNLYLTDKTSGIDFTDDDQALVEALAIAAGIAIEHNRLKDQERRRGVLEDRDRIACDLHDTIIQRVYAVGIGLHGAMRLDDLERLRERVSAAVDELDETIAELRGAIFELGQPAVLGGLRQAVLRLALELTESLGSRPSVRFVGAVDNTVPQPIGDNALAVVREGLTNAAKYSNGARFEVVVRVEDNDVTVEVVDDGCGIEFPLPNPGLGLSNLRNRAVRLGGNFEVLPGIRSGTRLVWSVPI
jgi:signal transduction histidine kinase